MRVVVPFGASMGITLYPGPFYGPEPFPEFVAGSFGGASTAGFVRVYSYSDFAQLPVIRGGVPTTRNISDKIKSVGIALRSSAAEYSLPVFGPECPPVGRFCWTSSSNPVVYGSRGATYVSNRNAWTGPVDLCSIWKVGCGPNPTGTEQGAPASGSGDTPPATGSDGRLIVDSIRDGDRGTTDRLFIPWSQSLSS
ncbi:MAG: hypothetical protein KatS3mg060_1792 [Dehalococcoidia bacterium]|nr:MAG: hypothetical protein KatS3mg060_1792 [Dehalococcoidia bacterium]